MRKLGREAEAAAINRSFLLSLGAEIREPLSLIMGNAELLAASVGGGAPANFSAIATDIRSGATALLDRVSLANDLCRSGSDDVESERVAVGSLLRDLVRKLEPRASAVRVAIALLEPAATSHIVTSKLHLRRMVYLFADSLLSIARAGSTLEISVEAVDGRTSLRMALPPAPPGANELAASFGVAMALAHRLGITTGVRLDSSRGHELALGLPPAEAS